MSSVLLGGVWALPTPPDNFFNFINQNIPDNPSIEQKITASAFYYIESERIAVPADINSDGWDMASSSVAVSGGYGTSYPTVMLIDRSNNATLSVIESFKYEDASDLWPSVGHHDPLMVRFSSDEKYLLVGWMPQNMNSHSSSSANGKQKQCPRYEWYDVTDPAAPVMKKLLTFDADANAHVYANRAAWIAGGAGPDCCVNNNPNRPDWYYCTTYYGGTVSSPSVGDVTSDLNTLIVHPEVQWGWRDHEDPSSLVGVYTFEFASVLDSTSVRTKILSPTGSWNTRGPCMQSASRLQTEHCPPYTVSASRAAGSDTVAVTIEQPYYHMDYSRNDTIGQADSRWNGHTEASWGVNHVNHKGNEFNWQGLHIYRKCDAAWCLTASKVVDDVGVQANTFTRANDARYTVLSANGTQAAWFGFKKNVFFSIGPASISVETIVDTPTAHHKRYGVFGALQGDMALTTWGFGPSGNNYNSRDYAIQQLNKVDGTWSGTFLTYPVLYTMEQAWSLRILGTPTSFCQLSEPYPRTSGVFSGTSYARGRDWSGGIVCYDWLFYDAFAAALAPTAAEASSEYQAAVTPTSTTNGDPHIALAHGGKTDFRGLNGRYFAYLSARDLSVAVRTEDSLFRLGGATVFGSFLTEVHLLARGEDGHICTLSYNASELNDNLYSWRMVRVLCADERWDLGPHAESTCKGIDVKNDYTSTKWSTGPWTVTIGAKPVYDWLWGAKKRIDVKISLRAGASVTPHGLVGQSFRKGAQKRDGRRDTYPISGPYMTTAQAEGSIEGVYTDYLVDGPHGRSFLYSTFDTKASATPIADALSAIASD